MSLHANPSVLTCAAFLCILLLFRYQSELAEEKNNKEDFERKLQEFVLSETGKNMFYMFTLPFIATLFANSPQLIFALKKRTDWGLCLRYCLFHAFMKTSFMILGHHKIAELLGLKFDPTDFHEVMLLAVYWMRSSSNALVLPFS